jgi:hypothetical protein
MYENRIMKPVKNCKARDGGRTRKMVDTIKRPFLIINTVVF